MHTSPDTATWVALGIASYAAIVSTYHEVAQQLERRRAMEREVRVEGQTRLRPARDSFEPIQMVRVVNSKTRPVEILRVGVVTTNGLVVWQPPTRPRRGGKSPRAYG